MTTPKQWASVDLVDEIPDVESAIKTLKTIQTAANQNAKNGEELARTLERVDEDLTKALGTLDLLKARANAPSPLSVSDASLKRFVLRDGSAFAKGSQGVIAPNDLVWKGFHHPETGRWVKGLLDQDTPTDNPWLQELRKALGDFAIIHAISSGRGFTKGVKTCAEIARLLKSAPEWIAKLPSTRAMLKAFTDSSGAGAEWIIDLGVVDLLDNNPLIRGGLAGRFMQSTMNAQTEVIPEMVRSLRPFKYTASAVDDPAVFNSSSITTAQRTKAAAGMVALARVDRDASEDSILAAGEVIRREMSATLRDGREDCIVNGDTAASHIHTGLTGFSPKSRWGSSGLGQSDDHRRCFEGLHKIAATNNSGSGYVDLGSAQTYAGYRSLLAEMTGTGGMPNSNTFYAGSKSAYLKALGFSEYATFDVVQGMGTNEGAGVRFAGFDFVVSDFISEELNASGVYDNSTKTKTAIFAINADRIELAERRGVVVESDVDITKNQNLIVGRWRGTLFPYDTTESAATNVDVVCGYNLTS